MKEISIEIRLFHFVFGIQFDVFVSQTQAIEWNSHTNRHTHTQTIVSIELDGWRVFDFFLINQFPNENSLNQQISNNHNFPLEVIRQTNVNASQENVEEALTFNSRMLHGHNTMHIHRQSWND